MAEQTARWTCACGRSNFSRSYPCMECGEPPPGGLDLDTPASGGSPGPSDRFPTSPGAPAGPAPAPQWTPPPGWVAPAHWSPPAAAPATADPSAPPAGPAAPPADTVPGDEAAWPYPTAPLPAPSADAPPPYEAPSVEPPPVTPSPAPLPPPSGYGYPSAPAAPAGYPPPPAAGYPRPPTYPPPPPAAGYPPPGQWGALPYAASGPDYTYVPAAPSSASRRNLVLWGGAVAAVLVLAVVALAVIGSKKSSTNHPTVSASVAEQQVASALLATVPAGYVAAPSGTTATGPLDAAGVAKLEQDPTGAARLLARYGFEGAFGRGWSRQAKPGVIVAIGYQFASAGAAKSYYDLYLLAQRNKPGTNEFAVTDLRPADGFTDATDKAVTLQTVVLLRGRRVFVIGIGDPSGGATTSDATALAHTQAKSG